MNTQDIQFYTTNAVDSENFILCDSTTDPWVHTCYSIVSVGGQQFDLRVDNDVDCDSARFVLTSSRDGKFISDGDITDLANVTRVIRNLI